MSINRTIERIEERLNHIQGVLFAMSTTAAQAQADLTTAVTNLTGIVTSAVTLLNQLAAANAAGTQLDPAAVEAQVAAINAAAASLSGAVTADTPAPAATTTPTTPAA